MDASDLKMFEAVARLGGMNRAAEELNTVQSNVTQRIKRLEDELGTPLFDRHSRGVSLTAAGQRLMPYARDIRTILDDARRAVAEAHADGHAGLVGRLQPLAEAPGLHDAAPPGPPAAVIPRASGRTFRTGVL